jgi:hypothetical protein
MLSHYVCTNCGYWQRHFAEPTSCPMCLDVRHVPPRDGWEFHSPEEMDGRTRCRWEEVEPGVWRFSVKPPLGIGPTGYLITRPEANVAFEGADWYDDAALGHLESLGGVAFASASHPHAYGALWRLQDRFGAEVAVQREDLSWASALDVSRPFDEVLELAPGLDLLRVGGHFDGQSVLHHREAGIVFAGDALKLELEEDGRTAHAISCHKSFVRGIPLTGAEVGHYRAVFAGLDFEQIFTTFEQGKNVGRKEVLGFLDRLLAADKPTMEPMPL